MACFSMKSVPVMSRELASIATLRLSAAALSARAVLMIERELGGVKQAPQDVAVDHLGGVRLVALDAWRSAAVPGS